MEEITFSINVSKRPLKKMNVYLLKYSKKEGDHYTYKIENSTMLRSLMHERDFAQMYRVVLLNHLFKSLIAPELRNTVPVKLVYSDDLDEYDPDKTFAETIADFSNSNKEYEWLLIEFENLIEKYGFKCRVNHIFVWQLMEVIDIAELNDGLYEFV